MQPIPGSGTKPLALKFTPPCKRDIVDRYVDAEANKHSDKAVSWKSLDMSRKWKVIKDYIAGKDEYNADTICQSLLAGRLTVIYDTTNQSISSLVMS
jgi:hypothetical protein